MGHWIGSRTLPTEVKTMSDADPGLMTIFSEALARTDPAERAAYLDVACGDGVPLGREPASHTS
jgi:hypothetical protein